MSSHNVSSINSMKYHLDESCVLGLQITLLAFHVINSLLHGFGTYILTKIVKQRNAKPQHIFLLGLSTSECVMNVLEGVRVTPGIVHHNSVADDVTTFTKYLQMITFSGTWLVVYLMMVYITIDRLLLIAMRVQYHKIMSRRRAMFLLVSTWVAGGIFALATILSHQFLQFDWEDAYFKYFYSIVDFLFIILALITYQYIFAELKLSHKRVTIDTRPTDTKDHDHLQVDEIRRLTNSATNLPRLTLSRFYPSILLVLTFVIFLIVPDLTYLFYGIVAQKKSDALFFACSLSYAVANFTDVIIYLYMQPRVRKEVDKLRQKCSL